MEGWHKEVRILDEVSSSNDLWADAVARSRRVSSVRPHLSRRLAGALVLTIAVVAAGLGTMLSLGSTGHARSGHSHATSGSGAEGPHAGPGPLGVDPWGADGATVTLSQLETDISYAIPLPNSAAANPNNQGDIWENTVTHAVAVYYPSSGIELVYGGTGVDFGGPASPTESIGGIKSLIIPAGTEDQYNRVLVPLPGSHLVTVVGAGSVSDLTSVAASIVSNVSNS